MCRIRKMVKQFYELQVYDEFVVLGNTAVLRCHVPSFVRDYVAVTSWVRGARERITADVSTGYTIFWKGKDAGEPRIHGAGFAVKKKIVKDLRLTPVSINERLMTLRVPIGSDRFITFVSAYAPTLDSDEDTKNQFYHQLNSTLSKIPIQDKLILPGDFNARVGRDNRFWRDVMGKQGVGNCNANGLLLLGICAEHELFISNTQFRLRNRYKTTWMHPRSKHWHLIDYVITRQRDKKDILITKAALNIDECSTDHRLLVSRLRVPKYRKLRSHFSNPPRRKFNISNLNNKNVRSHFHDILSEQLNKAPATTDDVEQEWTTLKNIIKETAENVVGCSARKRSDWFDDNHGEIQAIINRKRDAYLSLAQDPSCAEKKAHFLELKQKCQSEIRVIKNKWWQQKATELQNLSDARNLRGFYAGIKERYGPIRSSSGALKAADNSTILTESGRYSVFASGELHIRHVTHADGALAYRCEARHRLTGETRLSTVSGRLLVTEPQSSVPPRITDSRSHVTVRLREPAELPCAAQGFPLPTYT
ncbi:uncharacterized protein LOC124594066 [Schistocerca americana]|uniref:uncharacterized protein LOC124594066 n=1 Tax=Schistocerca americana TaxID=7009 RepID=UPI001F4F72F2|nr:uncharacterized protein LOC124594066 [Schistocerca americana]